MLSNSSDELSQAIKIWRKGGLVAFPTETVYGLGADATNSEAVAAIYAAKGRPQFNPLIIHVASLDIAQRFGVFDETSLALAHAHWPGPLSIVVPVTKGSGLSDLVTAGLDTVAIRIPENPLAQELLQAFAGAIAAPSANPSGAISPTTARHVKAGLNGKIDAIINGGACSVGLESTIVMAQNGQIHLLRAGGLSAEEISDEIIIKKSDETAPTSPGQLLSHYAPNAKLRMNAETAQTDEYHIGFGEVAGQINLSRSGDLKQAAANLFSYLRMADEDASTLGKTKIAVAPIPMNGLGVAINDRLQRASAPRD